LEKVEVSIAFKEEQTQIKDTMLKRKTLVLLVCLLFNPAISSWAESKPNIVFILVDDLGWRDLSNEGSSYYETPNIDRLAGEGTKFTRGYAASQVCSSARASILTGKYPPKHGITTWIGDPSGVAWRKQNRFTKMLPADYDRRLRTEEITLAEVLRNAGYKTFFAGKWHLGGAGSGPTDHGFDINVGGTHSGSPHGGYFSPYNNPAMGDGPPGESLTIRLGQETADFIEAHHDQPFLAYLSFYAVHGPLQTTPDLWKKYRDKAVAADSDIQKERFLWDRRLSVRQVQDCPIYAGMIELMDDSVGIVLEKLAELGLEENTIVCFTSDHGGVSSGDGFATSNLPLRGGKGRQWEGGLRVPFYIRAPGISQSGTTSDIPVHGIDWYPTLLDLAKLSVPPEHAVDGVSLVPILKGKSIADRPLFWHYPHYGNQGGDPSSVITHQDWKLIHYHEDGRDELYYLVDDPGERNDLASTQPEQVNELRAELDSWLREVAAKFPVHDPEFDEVRFQATLDELKTKGKRQLERRHASFLEPDFKPNNDWWGSTPVE